MLSIKSQRKMHEYTLSKGDKKGAKMFNEYIEKNNLSFHKIKIYEK